MRHQPSALRLCAIVFAAALTAGHPPTSLAAPTRDEVIDKLSEAIRARPGDAKAYMDRGDAWADRGEFAKAIADYTEVIRLDPKRDDALYNRGVARQMKGDLDHSIADFTEAIRLAPNLADAHEGRGESWVRKGDYDKAITILPRRSGLTPIGHRPFALGAEPGKKKATSIKRLPTMMSRSAWTQNNP